MKKTFVAAAVLGAFAGSAFAADVTLYGVVDQGLNYTRIDSDVAGKDATNTFEMKSGNQAGSRWGLKGTEELGDGYKVGFILESGFTSDDGAMVTSGTLFNREASLSLYTPFGQISAGKIGSIVQGTSSWGKLGYISALGTSYGNYVAQAGAFASTVGVLDNMVAYQTPSFAGFKVYAQYSFGKTASAKYKEDGTTLVSQSEVENKSSTDRYYVIGATYDNGPFAALLAVDSTNYKSWSPEEAKSIDTDDSLTVTLGGSYNFGVVKVSLGGQYFDEVKANTIGVFKGMGLGAAKVEGYTVIAGLSAPVAGGTAYFGAGYADASEADSVKGSEYDVSAYTVSAGYKYDLSKRTNVYGFVSYVKADVEEKNKVEVKPSAVAAMVGLRHNF